MKKIKFDIFGMSCQGCTNTVQITLKNFPGIKTVEVNLIPPEAVVICDNEIIPEKIIKHLEKKTHYKALVKLNK